VPAADAFADDRGTPRLFRAQFLVGPYQHLLVRTRQLVFTATTVVVIVIVIATTIRNRPPVVVVTLVWTTFGECGRRDGQTQYERRGYDFHCSISQHAEPPS
jgi:hypothetical protein